MKRRTIFILPLLLLALATNAQDDTNSLKFTYKGFLDSYHAVQTSGNNNFMSSRTRMRFESGLEKDNVSAFVSLNAVYNPILEAQTGVFLREAYFTYSNNGWNFKTGKQIVSWGVADGLQLTDIISPMDYTEFLAQDYDDIRVPVTAFKLGYGTSTFNIEAIAVPISEFFVLPTDEANPWSVSMNGQICQLVQNKPAHTFKNCEFGVRGTFYFSGIDFSLCALRTFNKMPSFTTLGLNTNGQLLMNAEYGRMTMVGGDLSIPAGEFVIRGEVAEYFDALQSVSTINTKPAEKNQTLALAGLDWYAGNDWTIMFQYMHTYISNYESSLNAYQNTGMATASVKKELLRNTLKLSALGRIDCANNGAFFIRFNADYLLTDQISLTAGYDWFNADTGSFEMYKDNSEVFVKAKFSF